jgi:hypothetical protein
MLQLLEILQPSAFSLQPSAFSLQPSAFSLQPSAFSLAGQRSWNALYSIQMNMVVFCLTLG